ncbi:hypothetical protein BDP27DRAFT_738068 [Rhodocollybia butyracea]|uniref:Uncharacterized protein n=1 Tax=Rhodocollybia butyracea TaxID=206335 RepID=A0A9P5PNQ4_9AGAR|nr:hypothetical protein BDP27DRAFT_738068 [Rhodocollybia butyracea]
MTGQRLRASGFSVAHLWTVTWRCMHMRVTRPAIWVVAIDNWTWGIICPLKVLYRL